MIAEIDRRSPFHRAGLRSGDVIIALDGDPVQSPEEFTFRLAALGVGGTTDVSYLRRGRPRSARVPLEPQPGR